MVSLPGRSVSDTQTRPANETAYTELDVVGDGTNLAFDFAGVKTSMQIIAGARLRFDKNVVPSGMGTFRLHLYNAAPTAIADNAAFNVPEADRAKYLGYITIPTPVDLGDTIWAQVDNVNFMAKCAAGMSTLYGILQTVEAWTPASGDVFNVELEAIQC